MTALYAYFVRRPLLVNLLVVLFIATGSLSAWQMRYDTLPPIELGLVKVTTYRPGSGPEEVELSVSIPLEDEILKVDGLAKVTSNSLEGMSVILVRLSPDVENQEAVVADIQKAVDRAAAKLPGDLPEKPLVEELASTRVPVLEVHVTGAVAEETLRFTSRQLEKGLRDVAGVAGVEKAGYRQREVRILLQPDRLHQLGMPFGEIADAIARRNVRDTGGSLESFIAEKKVLTVGQFAYPTEVEQVVIRTAGPGDYVRVRDVADVVLDYEDWKVQSRTDGSTGITLQVRKKAEACGLRTAAAVRRYIGEVRSSLPAGVEITLVNDYSRFTLNMLSVLTSNAALGALLAMVVLLAFCDLRLAFWVAFGIPVSVCLAFTVMKLCGLGINVITLTGLILVLGMLVDDAVVTGEGIYRLQESGVAPEEASIQGSVQMAAPVVMSTLTTVLAFAPMAFLGGYEGKLLWALPATAMVALLASLIECQLMLPSHLAHGVFARPRTRRWLRGLIRVYGAVIAACLRHRYLTILAFCVISIVVGVWGAGVIRFNLYPEMDVDTFFIKVELPEGTRFSHTAEKVRELERLVADPGLIPTEDLLNVNVQVGHHDTDLYGVTEGRSPAWALITVFLRPMEERQIDSNQVVAALRRQVRQLEGYGSVVIQPLEYAPVMGRPVQVEVIGNDASRFALGEILAGFLKQHPGVTEVLTSYKPGKDVVNLKLNHSALADRGLSVADVVRAVRIAFDGEVIDELQTVDEEIEYRLQYQRQEQGKLETLRDLTVINRYGLPVPLRGVVELEERPGEAAIKHYYGERTLTIFADIDRSRVSTSSINRELAEFVQREKLLERFDRLRLWYGGELEQQQESLGNVGTALAVCLLAIFLLLVGTFNSFTQPLLIMAVIPFGFTGVVIGFASQGLDMSMLALVGVIGLAGVLVNDSLVLVDVLNQRDAGDSRTALRDEEVVAGAQTRLRPILVTSLTTIAGLVPGAYGLAGYNPYMTPILMVIIWGVGYGTLVTLLLLPCLYAVDRDVRSFYRRILGVAAGGSV